ncbi:succinylglutamate desuccinylase/aspartoacylase family protein [Devosia sp. 2618]|uniref:succinylglutamate desuccinylase/aspartoacylase family protein n=1 Tax=Devosia sp. 2618 TaxID=3156454 RepID=UPI003394E4A1
MPVGAGGGALDTSIAVEVIVGDADGPTLVLMGGLHGDEYEAVLALHRVSRALNPQQVKGRVVIIAAANPVSLALVDRRFPPDLTDLNRVFPGNPAGTPSQRIAAALFDLVRGADFFYSLHSWSKTGTIVPHIEYGAMPGLAQARSLDVAMQLGFPFVQHTDWPSGLLVAAALSAGVPCLEGEVGGLGSASADGVDFYEQTIWRCLTVLGHLGVSEKAVGAVADQSRIVEPSDIRVNRSGYFVAELGLGATVGPGTVVGRVVDDFGDDLEVVRAERAGIIGTMRTTNAVHAGDRVIVVFSELQN